MKMKRKRKNNFTLTMLIGTICMLVFLSLPEADSAEKVPSTIFAWSTVEKYFAGQHAEYIIKEDVLKQIGDFPGNYELIGVNGCFRTDTKKDAAGGEGWVMGTVENPKFELVRGQDGAELKVRDLKDERINFMTVAVCDPADVIEFAIEDVSDLFNELRDRLSELKYKGEPLMAAGVVVEGKAKYLQFKSDNWYIKGEKPPKGTPERHIYFVDKGEKTHNVTIRGVYTGSSQHLQKVLL